MGAFAMSAQTSPKFRYTVINLEREPGRLANFLARNDQTKIPIEHFKAIDGAKLTSIDATILTRGAFYTLGATGNAMSHLALWKECVSSDTNFVIFEDDAHIRHDLSCQLHNICEHCDWDLIMLGYNMNTTIELNISPDIDLAARFSVRFPSIKHLDAFVKMTEPIALCRLRLAFGLGGYAVTPKGAALLTEKCFPLDNHPIYLSNENRSVPAFGLDCMMIAVYPTMRAYLCLPPLVMTPNDRATSQVQRR
jgi:GR25 family glycosyltransferase involved in LPS biosynthesis